MSDHANRFKQINKSGFPFQLRVEHEIRSTQADHHWSVASSASFRSFGGRWLSVSLAVCHCTHALAANRSTFAQTTNRQTDGRTSALGARNRERESQTPLGSKIASRAARSEATVSGEIGSTS